MIAEPTAAELRAIAKLLDQEWEDVEGLALAVVELRDHQREAKQNWIAVAQEYDPATREPRGIERHEGTPAGNCTAFPPVSTHLQAQRIALQVTYSPTKTHASRAWVLEIHPGTPATWWKAIDEREEREKESEDV